jgi:hypothetical protein
MFLTNLGAVVAVTGSALVLGTVGVATLLRALARRKPVDVQPLPMGRFAAAGRAASIRKAA